MNKKQSKSRWHATEYRFERFPAEAKSTTHEEIYKPFVPSR